MPGALRAVVLDADQPRLSGQAVRQALPVREVHQRVVRL